MAIVLEPGKLGLKILIGFGSFWDEIEDNYKIYRNFFGCRESASSILTYETSRKINKKNKMKRSFVKLYKSFLRKMGPLKNFFLLAIDRNLGI